MIASVLVFCVYPLGKGGTCCCCCCWPKLLLIQSYCARGSLSAMQQQQQQQQQQPFSAIPFINLTPSPERSTAPFNPWELNHAIHAQMQTPIYRTIVAASDGPVESVWINDEAAARQVLQDPDGIWRKGPQTFEPFSSLVPKHLIALEGEEHALMRVSAQSALNDLIAEDVLPSIAKTVAHSLNNKLNQVVAGSQAVWFAQPGRFENEPVAICNQVDRMYRAAALDIVSTAIFGESWGALDDYSASNKLADTLGKVMYELHWRVVDFTKRDWRLFHRAEPAGSLLDVLDAFIECEIDKSLSRQEPTPCMLDSWTRNSKLSRDLVRNLCLTFLTMGHENVASGLAWTTLCLAHNPVALNDCRAGGREALENAFNEAVRLYPSVAGLTRTNMVATNLLGYEIPRFTEVIVETYSIHRNPITWGENAGKFSPARCPFVSTNGPPDAFPFGVGKRSCVGRPLSLVELNNVVAGLISEFDIIALNLGNGQKRSIKMTTPTNMVSLRPGLHSVAFSKRRPTSGL